MNRRGFMQAILAAGVAPAVVKAASLMPVVARPLWVPSQSISLSEQALNDALVAIEKFIVPRNVTSLWITTIGAGAGGSGGGSASARVNISYLKEQS